MLCLMRDVDIGIDALKIVIWISVIGSALDSQKELAAQLAVTQAAISKRLHAKGKIQKVGK